MLHCSDAVHHGDTMAHANKQAAPAAPCHAPLPSSIAHELLGQANAAAICCCKGRQRSLLA